MQYLKHEDRIKLFRKLSHKQLAWFSVTVAKWVLPIFKQYDSNDKRPELAIQTAIHVINAAHAADAVNAAYAAYAADAVNAAYAAYAADASYAADAAYAAAYAAVNAAAYAANAAADAAYAANSAANSAANAAVNLWPKIEQLYCSMLSEGRSINRTIDINGLIEEIKQGNLKLASVLADALEDSGYTEVDTLETLRNIELVTLGHWILQ